MEVADGATRRWADERLGLGLLLAAVTALALLYGAVTPPFEGPDAGGHFGYVVWLRAHGPLAPLDAATVAASHELVQQPPLYYGLVALATAGMALSPTLAADLPNPHYPGLSHRATISPPGVRVGTYLPARVAAWVSLVGALVAVLATWGLVRALLPGLPGLALAAAAVVGLNPQFLFAAASITNDAWACATVTAAAWLAARLARRHAPAWRWLVVGVLAGAAALTKYSGLVVLLPVGALWLWWARRQPWPERLLAAGALLVGWSGVAGWWYAANLARAGELVPLSQLPQLLPGLGRSRPTSWRSAWGEASWLGHSYWGVFGNGVLAAPAYFAVTGGLVWLGIVGLVALPARIRGRGDRRAILASAGLALVWFGAAFAGWLNWIRHLRLANQGRLMFPAAAAVGLLLVLGWWALAPARWQRRAVALLPLVFLALALWQAGTLADAYRTPPALAEPPAVDRPLDLRFEGGLHLVGVDLPAGGAVVGGQALPVRLYLRAIEPITRPAIIFVHLVAGDRQLAGYDGVPAGGRHPTQQWLPERTFADDVDLSASRVPSDTLAMLMIGFYDPETRQPLRVLNGSGIPVADSVNAGAVMVHARQPDAPDSAPHPIRWANGIVLRQATVHRADDGTPVGVDVDWATEQPVQTDLTVFLQLLDAAGQLVGQADVKPRSGASPTSTWVPGYPVRDTIRLAPPKRPWRQLIIGFYDAGGRRVPLAGAPGADHLVLARP